MPRAEKNKHGIISRKAAQIRMELIRKENLKRHNEVAARRTLRDSQLQAQRVRTMQAELDRLHANAIHGNGLDEVRFNRMNSLKEVLGSYK
jgi:hypothetical protein